MACVILDESTAGERPRQRFWAARPAPAAPAFAENGDRFRRMVEICFEHQARSDRSAAPQEAGVEAVALPEASSLLRSTCSHLERILKNLHDAVEQLASVELLQFSFLHRFTAAGGDLRSSGRHVTHHPQGP